MTLPQDTSEEALDEKTKRISEEEERLRDEAIQMRFGLSLIAEAAAIRRRNRAKERAEKQRLK